MPYYCAERIARALNGHRKPVRGQPGAAARRLVQGRRRRRARVARAEADRAAARGWAPTSPTTTRTCRRSARRVEPDVDRRSTDELLRRPTSSASSPPTPASTTTSVAERAQLVIDFRERGVRRRRRQGGEAVSDRVTVGMVGLGGWGKNLLRNFAALPEADLRWCLRRRRGPPRGVRAGRTRRRASPPSYDELLDDPDARRRRARHARADPLRAGPAGDRGRQARDGREADDLDGRRGPRAARRWSPRPAGC